LAVLTLSAALQLAALPAKASHISAIPPSPPAERYQAQVFAAVEAAHWKTAYALAARTNDKVFGKLIAWIDYTQLGSRARFADIAAFMEQNPDWPDQHILQRNAEEALADSIPAATVIDWFSRRRPLTVRGRTRLAQALLDSGETEKARTLLRETWVEGNFPRLRERYFLKRYRKFLRKADHAGRLDRLLWVGRTWEARRMLRRVDAGQRALAVARIRLRRFRGGVDWAIRQVPKALTENLGLVYERLRWRRRKGRDADARALLDSLPPALTRPEIWWRERAVLARRALRGGEISAAYALASTHRQTRGKNFAEAEWLAGWISLRFLDDAEIALKHFSALHANVRYPISRARGAYWAGRAAEATGNGKAAQQWYAKAASLVTTFYGQLGTSRLNASPPAAIPKEPAPGAGTVKAFAEEELVKATRLLGASPNPRHMRRFILHLNTKAQTPEEHKLIVDLAESLNRPDLAVAAAKKSLRAGVFLLSGAYPLSYLPTNRNGVEAELLLSLLRQESAFEVGAVSYAGARGLMQLMPATARRVARRLRLGYSKHRLLNDPEFNLAIGTAFLNGLLNDYRGSYVLALAAYNAGPSRVKKWIRNNGDPRDSEIDVIDWIEMIPFNETRNYVQRVLENVQMYRVRTGKSNPGFDLENDLNR
jgi:soluble lytic murein transglycosylase